MDGLSDEERAKAWEASWHPSFAGIAIVDRDFRFRSANPQFYEILGVSPAELIGKRFQDVTPQPIKELDEKNAKLVVSRSIESYLLPKTYEFASGKRIRVVLLVKGVYGAGGEFLFFVSRIMLDQKPKSPSATRSQKPTDALDFLKNYGKIFAAVGAFTGALFLALLKAWHEHRGDLP